MKIAVLGTGVVGQTLAEKLSSLEHQVWIGTRNVIETLNREAFKNWHDQNSNVQLATFAEVIGEAELIINALQGAVAVSTIASCQKSDFDHKIIIDLSNPLDFSKGFPPSLIDGLNNTHSLGEEIQGILPNAKVVKTLNTMWCELMVNPHLVNNGQHTNFICGNDSDAKDIVIKLLNTFGWRSENILDLGDIENARGTEATLLIWIRIYGARKSGAFQFNIVQ